MFEFKLNKSGFTLVETLVAIMILITTLTGVFAVFSINRDVARQTKYNFIASGLVQEGIEVVHNLRDNDWLQGRPFGSLGGSSGFPAADGNYRVQWNSNRLLPVGTNPVLFVDTTTGLYAYNSGSGTKPTVFRRIVTIKTPTGPNPAVEKIVIVTVSWKERGRDFSISAEEHLFDWL